MPLPSKLKISCFNYKVEHTDELKFDGQEAFGTHEYGTLTMRIKKGLPPAVEAATIMHELLHAVFGTTGLYKTEEHEEAVVEGFSIGLCQVFKDNPELYPYIKGLLDAQE